VSRAWRAGGRGVLVGRQAAFRRAACRRSGWVAVRPRATRRKLAKCLIRAGVDGRPVSGSDGGMTHPDRSGW